MTNSRLLPRSSVIFQGLVTVPPREGCHDNIIQRGRTHTHQYHLMILFQRLYIVCEGLYNTAFGCGTRAVLLGLSALRQSRFFTF